MFKSYKTDFIKRQRIDLLLTACQCADYVRRRGAAYSNHRLWEHWYECMLPGKRVQQGGDGMDTGRQCAGIESNVLYIILVCINVTTVRNSIWHSSVDKSHLIITR